MKFDMILHKLQDNPHIMVIVLDADDSHDYLVMILHELEDNPDIMGIVLSSLPCCDTA